MKYNNPGLVQRLQTGVSVPLRTEQGLPNPYSNKQTQPTFEAQKRATQRKKSALTTTQSPAVRRFKEL